MRDLTEDELKLAPGWATHYWVHDGKVMFESVDLFQLLNDGKLTDTYGNDSGYITGLAVEIKGKPFDISEFVFSDKWVRYAKLIDDGDYLTINISNESFNTVIHNKQDAIAIAKALGVTAEDLL